MRAAGLLWNSLGADFDSTLLGLTLFCIISVDAVNESLSALRLADVFNANVDALWHNTSANLLVDNHTNCMFGNIEDFSGFAMVEFVWNTVLD